MFDRLVQRIGGLTAVETALTAFVGGAVSYVVNSPDVVATIANMAATAATGSVWKGAALAGLSALFAKSLAKATPPSQ